MRRLDAKDRLDDAAIVLDGLHMLLHALAARETEIEPTALLALLPVVDKATSDVEAGRRALDED